MDFAHNVLQIIFWFKTFAVQIFGFSMAPLAYHNVLKDIEVIIVFVKVILVIIIIKSL